MSIEINNVVLGGNLTRDVELKETGTGRKVCSFAIATNSTYMSNHEKKTETSFVDIDVWGVIAENCAKYLRKGSPVVVIGRLKQERWESNTGDKRSKIKIVAQNVQFLSSGNRDQQNSDQQSSGQENQSAESVAWNE